MNLLRLFFSFRGRAGRASFWLVSLAWVVLSLIFGVVWSATGAADVQVGHDRRVDAAFGLWMLVLLASGLAIAVKRLHDRNKPAWWLLLFYVAPPAIETIAELNDLDSAATVWLMVLSGALSLWALLDLGCLRGTRGPNRYGPDPLLPEMVRD